ncbi:hypothetical protein EAI30_10695 [Romboutsia ilealis]|uniref:Uncharacterized protein n=1 Tax=Romboutsia faecis TaxID=2764597 RepID=A0ABR7JMW2_9FIRM|nr:hypothetical protein [Romboutsia faecis]MBC5996274.1 hypothetical protein [Romboutsia faecis]MRN25084.1 hypothetical protein [Romboutsia ilealis]
MVKIKRKILIDSIIYIALPIILYKLSSVGISNSYVFYLILGGICYTLYTKYKQNRTSISGLGIMTLLTLYIYFSRNQKNSFDLYIYATYIIGLSLSIILILNLFDRNICSQIYTDILNTKFNSDISINSLIRKRKLENEFNFLTTLIALHLLISILIRFYGILYYGASRYIEVYSLEILNLIIFTIIELYTIYKIIVKTMSDKAFSNKKNDKDINDGRVIDLSQYKRVNK